MLEPLVTVIGNVAAVPVLRELDSGVRVTGFRLANTPREVDKSTGEWRDGVTTWFGVTCWRGLAEHVAQSLKTGDRVVVTGRMRTRTWRTTDGEERSGLEIDAATVGFDLSRTSALATRPVAPTLTQDPGEQACGPTPEEPLDALDRELEAATG
ncbi:MAG: single-strand binding protein [Frankiales bacterium]|nr:single-strand binding protein [Frankiales bacterium]